MAFDAATFLKAWLFKEMAFSLTGEPVWPSGKALGC